MSGISKESVDAVDHEPVVVSTGCNTIMYSAAIQISLKECQTASNNCLY